jgi:pyruvate dehydrogenase E2 component (dihydrolipoamide acetyltransferase)
MAVKEVLVPDIGDFKDIEVIEVLVKPGDVINTDDSLITLESDKAAMEVPAPFPGVVKSVKVKPGDRVSLGSLILNLEVEEAKAATPAPVQEATKPVEVSLPTTPVETPVPTPSVSAVQPSGAPTVQELYVPDIGDYKDIEVIEVLVKPGDEVRADDSLITLESDKAAMEVPSPLSGIIKSISLKTGDRVSKGAVIALIETQTGGVSAAKAPEATAPEAPVSAPVPAPAQAAQPVVSHLSEEAPLDGGLSHASPGIRRLARELGVNLGKVRGTGPKNRIL